jgi:hypothetical protein
MNSVIQNDAKFFLDQDIGFGESIVFTRYTNGTPYTFNANVVRHSPEERAQNDALPFMDIWLERDSTWTRGPAAIDTGADTITVAYRFGGTAEVHGFSVPEDHDAGMFHIQIK